MTRAKTLIFVIVYLRREWEARWQQTALGRHAVLFVIDSRVCWSSMLLVMIATSSTHSRHVELVSMFVWVVHLALFISLLISSISVAYWVTASTPPCLMLLILMPIMGLVMPCLVVMVAVRFWLRRSVRSHVAPLHPCLFVGYTLRGGSRIFERGGRRGSRGEG